MQQKIRLDGTATKFIRAGDLDAVRKHFEAYPERLTWLTPFAGATWLHFAAAYGNPDLLEFFLKNGFNVNTPSFRDDARVSLVDACDNAQTSNAEFLIRNGSKLDISASCRNPLFASIVGKSPSIVKLLLRSGIDATVRYTSETMKDMDSIAFALWRGETELAEIIAKHLCDLGFGRKETLLGDAQNVVAANKPLELRYIVPGSEDIGH